MAGRVAARAPAAAGATAASSSPRDTLVVGWGERPAAAQGLGLVVVTLRVSHWLLVTAAVSHSVRTKAPAAAAAASFSSHPHTLEDLPSCCSSLRWGARVEGMGLGVHAPAVELSGLQAVVGVCCCWWRQTAGVRPAVCVLRGQMKVGAMGLPECCSAMLPGPGGAGHGSSSSRPRRKGGWGWVGVPGTAGVARAFSS